MRMCNLKGWFILTGKSQHYQRKILVKQKNLRGFQIFWKIVILNYKAEHLQQEECNSCCFPRLFVVQSTTSSCFVCAMARYKHASNFGCKLILNEENTKILETTHEWVGCKCSTTRRCRGMPRIIWVGTLEQWATAFRTHFSTLISHLPKKLTVRERVILGKDWKNARHKSLHFLPWL